MAARVSLWPLEKKEMNRNVVIQRRIRLVIILILGLRSALVPVTSAASLANSCSVSRVECNKLSSLPLTGHMVFNDIDVAYAGEDFGLMRFLTPAAVLYPGSVSDIVSVVTTTYATGSNVTIAARGPGHSTYGQSQALDGIVIEMSAIKGIDVNADEMFVEARAGELWVDVLQATLREGLTPKSFTDYLHLSVGGTLSNAGISGQAYRWGPQINNVLLLEIVTGTGELVTCSGEINSNLFFAALGGLGQFGIITKARISLQVATSDVRWIRALYSDFSLFKRDQELLISQANSSDPFDYVEGFVVSNTAEPQFGYNSVPFPGTGQTVNPELLPGLVSSPVLYYIELGKYYNNTTELSLVDKKISDLLAPLEYLPSQIFYHDVPYFDFLDRVHKTELKLRSVGKWEVPHPWMNIFVPASKMLEFDHTVFKSLITVDSTKAGPVIVYPLNKNKWDARMSANVPDEEVFYLVAFLPSVLPVTGPSLTTFLSRNSDVEKYCQGLGCKQYLPMYSVLSDWQTHFGDRWSTFVQNKIKFDPQAILAPGQNIFVRGQVPHESGYL